MEEEVLDTDRTRRILSRFPDACIIPIRHYKDVFNRRRQDPVLQHAHQNLILAAGNGERVFPGAPVCQDFGNEHFYYTSMVMNCLYDCEYCYLKGMYPSGNIVVFVNSGETYRKIRQLLAQFPVYLCISYDTDLLALEDMTGYVQEWNEQVLSLAGLTVELRTKCARTDLWDRLCPCPRFILAMTLSPEDVIARWEHGTPDLHARLSSAQSALRHGFPVRLCLDPMIWFPGWQESYDALFRALSNEIDLSLVRDFSVGSFRISGSYLKNLRQSLPHSALVQYPFEQDGGYYHYPAAVEQDMEQYAIRKIRELLPDASVFTWEKA